MLVAPTHRATPALETRDVSVRRCGRSLLQRASITVHDGEFLVLLGGEGSGTDTLLHLLAGALAPDAGRVFVDGRTWMQPAGTPSPRTRLATGAAPSVAVLDGADDEVALLERPTDGLDHRDAHHLLRRCRDAADRGRAVVATVASADLAAAHATTIGLFVAGRMLSWGSPAIALVPALQLIGDSGHGVR